MVRPALELTGNAAPGLGGRAHWKSSQRAASSSVGSHVNCDSRARCAKFLCIVDLNRTFETIELRFPEVSTHISYVSEGEAVLGWVLGSSIEDCPPNGGSSHAGKPPDVPSPIAGTKPGGKGDPPVGVPSGCSGKPLSVKFYDVGQALSALISLPDGRRVLVDTGEQAKRCAACKDSVSNRHEQDQLALADLGRWCSRSWSCAPAESRSASNEAWHTSYAPPCAAHARLPKSWFELDLGKRTQRSRHVA